MDQRPLNTRSSRIVWRLRPLAAGGVLVRKNGEMAARHRAQRTSRIYDGEMRCAAAVRADSEPLTERLPQGSLSHA
jgi:hypothetical protein